MVNAGDLFISLVAGLALPLALLDGLRLFVGEALPEQRDGFQIERRLAPWLLAVIAGPGLLIERLAAGWREEMLSRGDLTAGCFIALGWAMIYGFIVLRALEAMIGASQ